MGLQDQVILDINSITTNLNGFAKLIYLNDLSGNEATVKGIHSKHSNTINGETGTVVKGTNATASISESEIKAANPNYQIRNANNEVAMLGHKLNVTDSNGELRNYIILENWPDETLGLITFILGDYKAS